MDGLYPTLKMRNSLSINHKWVMATSIMPSNNIKRPQTKNPILVFTGLPSNSLDDVVGFTKDAFNLSESDRFLFTHQILNGSLTIYAAFFFNEPKQFCLTSFNFFSDNTIYKCQYIKLQDQCQMLEFLLLNSKREDLIITNITFLPGGAQTTTSHLKPAFFNHTYSKIATFNARNVGLVLKGLQLGS